MINIILHASLLSLIHLILPNSLRSKFGEDVSERAKKAAHNFAESLPVFFVLAILSIYLEVDVNVMIGLIWLILRLVYVLLYVSGIGTKPANERGYEAQTVRSLVWVVSIVCLVTMGINLT